MKRRKLTKALSLILSASMALGVAAMPAAAAAEEQDGTPSVSGSSQTSGETPTPTPTATPDPTESPAPTPTATPLSTESPTPTPSETPAPTPSKTPASSESPVPDESPASSETPAPDAEPENEDNTQSDSTEAARSLSDEELANAVSKALDNMGNVEIDLSGVEIDVDSINPNAPVLTDEQLASVEDIDDPLLSAVSDELDEMVVEGGEAESPIATYAEGDDAETGGETKTPLTDAEKKIVLAMFQQYLGFWYENEDVLGVQLPFYLNSNDNADDLGILGQMLVLAGVSVDDVRNGNYGYNDLTGMIMNFQYGDSLGVEYYGETIRSKRDEALEYVERSGAKTEAQKLLALNTWLAQNNTFDMSYIMNQSATLTGGEAIMVAPEPVQHEHYDDVHKALNAAYTEQLTAQFRTQFTTSLVYMRTVQNIQLELYKEQGMDADDATAEAQKFVAEHANEINADPQKFITQQYPEQAEEIIANAKEQIANPSDDVIAAVDQMMATQEVPELGNMTANEAIPIYADQAATGLTTGVIGYWEGNHIGALAEGASVCMGYAKAFAYLVQCMHPEIYLHNENNGLDVATNWKQPADLYYNDQNELDINKNYVVDIVRITFNADVTMYGQLNPDFASDHFWNAVKVDGNWYYIDPCYNDVWSEVMNRDRVEIDGYMNHTYFMCSHASMESMFGDYSAGIATLYAEAAVNKEYEDSWFARVASNITSDGTNFYYLYDSTDLVTMWNEYSDNKNNLQDLSFDDIEYKIVRHPLTETDRLDSNPAEDTDDEVGDSDFDVLINFTHKDDDGNNVVQVCKGNEMVDSEMLTELYAQFESDKAMYPSIRITPVYYKNKIYFNLSNCILSYDIESGEVVKVKEYNTVYVKRDPHVAFGGMAFDVVGSEAEADFTFVNHPLAGIALKNDGKLYVSVATNLSYIAGKDPLQYTDSSSFGYEFEESSYNTDYNSFVNEEIKDNTWMDIEDMGYRVETNDNDEFMWVANAVETMDMAHFADTTHSYATVSVGASCGHDAFTESRCTVCGAIQDGTREVAAGTALEHHFVSFTEQYYTTEDNKDVLATEPDGGLEEDQVLLENAQWNNGTHYVCPLCGYSVDADVTEDDRPNKDDEIYNYYGSYEEDLAKFEEAMALKTEAEKNLDKHTYILTDTAVWNVAGDNSATVTFNELTCSICGHIAIDCVQPGVSEAHPVLDQQYTLEATLTGSTTDANGVVWNTYEVSGEVEGYQVTGSYIVQAGSSTGTPVEPEKPGDGDNQGNQGGQTGGGSQPVDEHPDIAEGIANGTWGGTATTSASGSAEAPAPAAQQTAAIPETADEMPLQAVTIAAVLSGIAAAALVLLRKRNTDR